MFNRQWKFIKWYQKQIKGLEPATRVQSAEILSFIKYRIWKHEDFGRLFFLHVTTHDTQRNFDFTPITLSSGGRPLTTKWLLQMTSNRRIVGPLKIVG